MPLYWNMACQTLVFSASFCAARTQRPVTPRALPMPFRASIAVHAQPVRPTCIGTVRRQFMLILLHRNFEDTRQVKSFAKSPIQTHFLESAHVGYRPTANPVRSIGRTEHRLPGLRPWRLRLAIGTRHHFPPGIELGRRRFQRLLDGTGPALSCHHF